MDALGDIYEIYHPRLAQYCRRHVPSTEVEDVEQEVWEKVCKSISSFQDVGIPFSNYLYVIARNVRHDFYRRQHVTMGNVARSNLVGLVPDANSRSQPAEAVEQDYISSVLAREMFRLTNGQREALYLRYFLDLSIPEAAQASGKSKNNIKQQALKGIRKLQDRFAEFGEEWGNDLAREDETEEHVIVVPTHYTVSEAASMVGVDKKTIWQRRVNLGIKPGLLSSEEIELIGVVGEPTKNHDRQKDKNGTVRRQGLPLITWARR